MKRFFALTIGVFTMSLLAQPLLAGPEPLPNGKEMKQVAPAPLPECNWTGFYIGVHVGYGWNDLKWTDTDTSTFNPGAIVQDPPDTTGPELLVSSAADGVIAGGQIGYNYQFGRFVVGAEGEFSYSDVSDSSSNNGTEHPLEIPLHFRNDFKTDSKWVGTFGLRFGFAWNKFLLYAKGGGAVMHQEYSLNHTVLDEGTPFPVDKFTADNTWLSPMAGAGIEYALSCHWSLKAEYNCLFWGADDITGTNVEDSASGAEPESYEVDLNQQHTVRVGLNYKF